MSITDWGLAGGFRLLEAGVKKAEKKFAALWGNGDYGRLGFGNLESQWRPMYLNSLVFDNQSLREIACGGAHTLFLTENGNVYATGLNDYGQLGISDDKSYTTKPVSVSGLLKEVIKISAGYHHSSAVTVDGELYMWGKNSNGQLGLGKKAAKVVTLPTKVECLNGVNIRITSLGFEHSVAVTDKREALSWGGGASGRLGHGHQSGILGFVKSNSEFTPRLIKDLEGVKVKSVAAGMLHSACIDENGFAYIFGETSKKKLGFEDENKATVPSLMRELPPSEEVMESCTHGAQMRMDALVLDLLTLLIHLKEFKVHFWGILFVRSPVVGSILLQFVEAMFTVGVGEALMELSPKMDTLLEDNWVMEMMLIALNLESWISKAI